MRRGGRVCPRRFGSDKVCATAVNVAMSGPLVLLQPGYQGRDEIELDGFTETGAGLANLSWSSLQQDSLSAVLGSSWRWSHDLRELGVVIPSIRLEWTHELEGSANQGVRYADWTASPLYLASVDGWARDQLRLDGGLEWRIGETLVGVGYRGSFSDTSVSHAAEFKLRWRWP